MTQRTHDPMADDQALDEHLNGGSRVSQRYRESADGAVPPQLDRRVLTMAREAMAKPAKARVWMRWTAPLAAAASAVVVLSIMLHQGAPEPMAVSMIEAARDAAADAPTKRRQSESSQAESESQFAAPPAMQAPGTYQSGAQARWIAESPAPRAVESEQRSERQDAPVAVQESDEFDAAPPPGVAVQQTALSQSSATERLPARSGPRNTLPAATLGAAQSTVADASGLDPKRWLALIRKLREQGKSEEADRQWNGFREAYPDYAVAESDLARK